MYRIRQHCQICEEIDVIEVDDEMFGGGVDADWHCNSPMIWDDDIDIDYIPPEF